MRGCSPSQMSLPAPPMHHPRGADRAGAAISSDRLTTLSMRLWQNPARPGRTIEIQQDQGNGIHATVREDPVAAHPIDPDPQRRVDLRRHEMLSRLLLRQQIVAFDQRRPTILDHLHKASTGSVRHVVWLGLWWPAASTMTVPCQDRIRWIPLSRRSRVSKQSRPWSCWPGPDGGLSLAPRPRN